MARMNFYRPPTNDTQPITGELAYDHYAHPNYIEMGSKQRYAATASDLEARVHKVQRDIQQTICRYDDSYLDMIRAVSYYLHKVKKSGEAEFKVEVRNMVIRMIYDLGFKKYPRSWYLKWEVSDNPLVDILCASAAFHLPHCTIPLDRKYIWRYLEQRLDVRTPEWLSAPSFKLADIASDSLHSIAEGMLAGIEFIANSDHEVKKGSQLAKALETARNTLIKEELAKQKINHKKGELNMKSITVQFSGYKKGYEYLVPEYLNDQLPTDEELSTHDYVAIVPGNNAQEDVVSVAKVTHTSDVASKRATVLLIDIVPLTENLAKNKAIYNKIKAKQELLQKAQARYENANKLALYEKAAEHDPDMKALLDQIKELDA